MLLASGNSLRDFVDRFVRRTSIRRSPTAWLWFTLALLCLASPATAGEATFSSRDTRTALVELYTSEGCSSCPPAERWINALEDERGLWHDFIPLALHVDYWDYIGWPDRFAKPEYAKRQRQYAAEGGARVVYTPGMFVNGEEWLGWRRGDLDVDTDTMPGVLSLSVINNDVAVHFAPAVATTDSLRVNIALVGMGLETEVRAGENKGRKLEHDFVALNVQSVALENSAAGYKAITELPQSDIESNRYAVVAWVTNGKTQAPIQAVGGYLP
ncbi:MAG: DUF1223 domain-containing protein [Pseudomonadota bacterium]